MLVQPGHLLEAHCRNTGQRLDLVRERIARDERERQMSFRVVALVNESKDQPVVRPPDLMPHRLVALLRANPELFLDVLLELLAEDIAHFVRNRVRQGGR